ncbi:MAG: reverse transcriptase domain-containing protein, partial [Candidatus Thiodiazotropha sp.]
MATPADVASFDKDYYDLVECEVREIMDMCCGSPVEVEPRYIAKEDVEKAISKLNRGKAADFYGVTAEHFLYGGEELLSITTDIINCLYRNGKLTDSLKTGVLTPVYKKKGPATESKNYRGITILPTITKILETVLREEVRPSVEMHQNKLQRGFTQNSSPMNCSLILEEIIRESKDRKQPLYIAFLDVKAAFDVVSHNSLLRKLFHIGIEGKEWSLIHSLHSGAESVVKWDGDTSGSFKVQQGVRQGGILSTDLYKLYGNGLLDRLTDMGLGFHLGEICCVAPTAADDMAIAASSLHELQRLITTSVDYSKMERYHLQPNKSVILAFPCHGRGSQEANEDINISMNGKQMPVVKEAMHMGILRSEDSQESAVTYNIDKARRTVYCLMGAGLHGENGLDPDTSVHVLQTYVIPVLVYGLEVVLPRKSLMEKIDRLHKKFLKQILSLPNTVADPAVYILSGAIPVEGVVHKRALTLFGSLCRLDEASIEKQLARRQLAVKGERSSSWFICIKALLLKYRLPAPCDLLDTPPTKASWKRQVREQVDNYWSDTIKSRAALYPSLRYLHFEGYVPGRKHQSIADANGVKDVPRIHNRIKMVTSSYILQTNRASFNQNQISPTCLLCQRDDETMEHFILHCCALETVRQPILEDIMAVGLTMGIQLHRENPADLLQTILDCSVIQQQLNLEVAPSTVQTFERHVRRLCHALHAERYKRLPLTVRKRVRNKKTSRKEGRSTNQP